MPNFGKKRIVKKIENKSFAVDANVLTSEFQKLTAWRDFCGTKKNSVYRFDLFFYVRNDSASYVEDFGILFFANRQFFLKFSKIGKKINFEPFFMHISL